MALTNTIFHTQKSRMKTVNHKYMSLAWTLQIPTCFICCICHAFASAFKKHMFTHFLGTYALQRSPRYDMSRGKLPLLANKATWSHWSIDWCCWNLANSFIINQWLDLRGSIWWEHSFIASNLDSWILIVNTNPTSSPSHVQQSPSACPRRFFVFLFHVHWSLRHSHLPLVMGRHWRKLLLPLKAHDLLIHQKAVTQTIAEYQAKNDTTSWGLTTNIHSAHKGNRSLFAIWTSIKMIEIAMK